MKKTQTKKLVINAETLCLLKSNAPAQQGKDPRSDLRTCTAACD